MRRLLLLAAALLASACASGNDLDKAPVPLGDFALGHNIVVAPNLVKGPLSRDATSEEWIAAVTKAVDDRFGRYEGDKLYHLGISVEGYVLAKPGVPLVLSPKSVVILRATVWDDAAKAKLNPEPREISILEAVSGNTLVGSGLTQSREVQLENLARRAAKEIETWLLREHRASGWFGGSAVTGTTAPTVPAPVETVPATPAASLPPDTSGVFAPLPDPEVVPPPA